MKKRTPPRLATWLLTQVAPDYHYDSFLGDLIEEFEHGKTRAWYWKQAFAALGVSSARRLRTMLTASVRWKVAVRKLLATLAVITLSGATLTWAGSTAPAATHPSTPPACAERR